MNVKATSDPNIHPFWKITFFIAIFISCSYQGISQEEIAARDLLRIKFEPGFAPMLDHMLSTLDGNGFVLTGLKNIDELNQSYKTRHFKRVFRDGGKFEQKHKKHDLHLWYELQINSNEDITKIIADYESLQEIQIAEPVYRKTYIDHSAISSDDNAPMATTNDSLFYKQWSLSNSGQTGGTAGADIDILSAWDIERGKREVIVAVVDGGIDKDHRDLRKSVWINEDEIPDNGIDDDNNGYIDDIHGYNFVNDKGQIERDDEGTHIAGIIGARSNNNVGISGIAGGARNRDGIRLMNVQIYRFFFDYAFDLASGYVYAADNGAVIAQSNWSYWAPNIKEQVVLDAIDYFIEEAGLDENGNQTGPVAGGIVVFGAGDLNSEEPFYPAAYDPVLAVAATNHNDLRSHNSNYGAWIDISAPGGEYAVPGTIESVGILSTAPNNRYHDGYYGTVGASPHVSGVAALIVSKFGGINYTSELVWDRIINNIDDIYPKNPAFLGKLGSGRLNAFKALGGDDEPSHLDITSLTLVDAVTNLDISTIANGDIIDLAFLPHKKINIRANTSPSVVGSVKFEVGNLSLTDNESPYTILGDNNNDDYNGIKPPSRRIVISAQAFSGINETGDFGTPYAVTIRFIDSSTREFAAFPNPVKDQISISMPENGNSKVQIQLLNQYGKQLGIWPYRQYTDEKILIDISTFNLPGRQAYYLKISSQNMEPKIIRFVKE